MASTHQPRTIAYARIKGVGDGVCRVRGVRGDERLRST
jgi:hypothetical protein